MRTVSVSTSRLHLRQSGLVPTTIPSKRFSCEPRESVKSIDPRGQEGWGSRHPMRSPRENHIHPVSGSKTKSGTDVASTSRATKEQKPFCIGAKGHLPAPSNPPSQDYLGFMKQPGVLASASSYSPRLPRVFSSGSSWGFRPRLQLRGSAGPSPASSLLFLSQNN